MSSDDFIGVSSSSSHESEGDFFDKSNGEKTPELVEDSENCFLENRAVEIR